MPAVSPSLSPAEARILDALLYGADRGLDRASDRPGQPQPSDLKALTTTSTLDLTRSLGLSASDLLAFAASPAVAAALDAIRHTLAAIDAVRFHSLHTLALNTLALVAETSPHPTQRRQAATTLLRATNPTPARRASQRTSERAAPASALPPSSPRPFESTGAPAASPAPTSHVISPPDPTRERAAPARCSIHSIPQTIAPPTPPIRPTQPTPTALPSPHHADLAVPHPRATTPGRDIPDPALPTSPAIDFSPPDAPPFPPSRRITRAALLTTHAGAPNRPP